MNDDFDNERDDRAMLLQVQHERHTGMRSGDDLPELTDGEMFRSKPEALRHIAKQFAGSAEAGGLDDFLDGMGILPDDLTDAQHKRADWAFDEVCRRLRKIGEPR